MAIKDNGIEFINLNYFNVTVMTDQKVNPTKHTEVLS